MASGRRVIPPITEGDLDRTRRQSKRSVRNSSWSAIVDWGLYGESGCPDVPHPLPNLMGYLAEDRGRHNSTKRTLPRDVPLTAPWPTPDPWTCLTPGLRKTGFGLSNYSLQVEHPAKRLARRVPTISIRSLPRSSWLLGKRRGLGWSCKYRPSATRALRAHWLSHRTYRRRKSASSRPTIPCTAPCQPCR